MRLPTGLGNEKAQREMTTKTQSRECCWRWQQEHSGLSPLSLASCLPEESAAPLSSSLPFSFSLPWTVHNYKRQENEELIKGSLCFQKWGERAEHEIFCPNSVMEWKLRTAGLLYHKWYQPVSPSAITFIKMSVCKEENKQKAHHCLWKHWWLNHCFIPESLRWSESTLLKQY